MLAGRMIGPRYLGAGRAVSKPLVFAEATGLEARATLAVSDTIFVELGEATGLEARAEVTTATGARDRKSSAGIDARAEITAAGGGAIYAAGATLNATAGVSGTASRIRPGAAFLRARANVDQAGSVRTRQGEAGLLARGFIRTFNTSRQRQGEATGLEARGSIDGVANRTRIGEASLQARATLEGSGFFFTGTLHEPRVIEVGARNVDINVAPKNRDIVFPGDDNSMALKRKTKQPWEVVDYGLRMQKWFDSIYEDFITDVTVTISPTGEDGDLESAPDAKPAFETVGDPAHDAKVWIGGGRDGIDYTVTCRVTTNKGRKEEIDFIVAVEEQQ